MLFSLEGTRGEINETRADVAETELRVQRLSDGFAPLIDAATPLAEAIAPLVSPSSRKDVRDVAGRLTAAADELPGLATDVDRGLGVAASIAEQVQAGDLAGTLAAVQALADTVVPADDLIPRASRLLAALDVPGGDSVLACDERLRSQAPSAPGQVGCLLRLVPNLRGLLRQTRTLLRKSLATQRNTEAQTRATRNLFKESIVIQRELLVHVRSLDNKTGGPAPTVTPP